MCKKFLVFFTLLTLCFVVSGCASASQSSAGLDDKPDVISDAADFDPAGIQDAAASDPTFVLCKYGTVDNVAIHKYVNFYDVVFGMGDYDAVPELDGAYPYVYIENPDFENLDLYLYPHGLNMTENHTLEDIEAYGFGSYHVDAGWCVNKPNMSWGGIRFGASEGDIMDKYGEPDYYDVYDDCVVLGYDFGDCELDFTVYNDMSAAGVIDFDVDYPDAGLQGVDFYVF